MAQPIRKNIAVSVPKKKNKVQRTRAAKIKAFKERMKGNQEYGTSKLEERFAHDFLDKLQVNYVYQYKAITIGRYFDFRICPELRGPIIEVDGDFYHSYGLVYEQMNAMQKRNKKVDEIKNRWCATNGVKLIRIWEHDINDHPKAVMDMLKKELKPYLDGTISNKKKRH